MLLFGGWPITRHGGVTCSPIPPLNHWLLAATLWLGGLRFGLLFPALVAWRAQQILRIDRLVLHFQGRGAEPSGE